ncbi:uncharacterized protein LOC144357383 [Saccoglossus kowalevskii]
MRSGELNEVFQKEIVTEEFLQSVDAVDVTLKTNILIWEYKRCRAQLIHVIGDDEYSKDNEFVSIMAATMKSKNVAEGSGLEGVSVTKHGVGKDRVILAMDFDPEQTTMGDIINSLHQFGSVESEYWGKNLYRLLYQSLLDIKQIVGEQNTRILLKSTDDQCVLLKKQLDANVIANLQIDKSNLEKTLSSNTAKIEELKEKIQQKDVQLTKSVDQIRELRNELCKKNEALEQLERHLADQQQYDEKTAKLVASLQFDNTNLQQNASLQTVKIQELKGIIHKMEEQTNDLKYQLSKTEVQNTEIQVTDEETTDTDKGVTARSPIDSDTYSRNKGGSDIGQLEKERKTAIPFLFKLNLVDITFANHECTI